MTKMDERSVHRAEVARLRAVLARMASDGCGGVEPVYDPVDGRRVGWSSCRDRHPDDREAWCWACLAAAALEVDSRRARWPVERHRGSRRSGLAPSSSRATEFGGTEPMSFILEVEIRCENCERWERFSGMTVTQAREELKDEGWSTRRVGGQVRDYCPQCTSITQMYKRRRSDGKRTG